MVPAIYINCHYLLFVFSAYVEKSSLKCQPASIMPWRVLAFSGCGGRSTLVSQGTVGGGGFRRVEVN